MKSKKTISKEARQVDAAILEVLKLFEMENDPTLTKGNSIETFDLNWEPKGSFSRHDAFSIWFVFPKKAEDKPYIVKGGFSSCMKFIEQKSKVAFAHVIEYFSTSEEKRSLDQEGKIRFTRSKRKSRYIGAEVIGMKDKTHCIVSYANVKDDTWKRETPSYKCKRWVIWVYNTWIDKRFVRKALPKCFPIELIPYTVEP
jgi:hypothetical protein